MAERRREKLRQQIDCAKVAEQETRHHSADADERSGECESQKHLEVRLDARQEQKHDRCDGA